jgi:hypothetical protein
LEAGPHMLILTLVLLFSAAFLEITIVYNIPWFGKILEEHPILAVTFSLIISAMLGASFGAAGLIALIAGVGSTILTWLIYRLRILHFIHWVADRKKTRLAARTCE